MKKILLLFLLLSLFSFSFATWQLNVGLAIFASLLLLIVIYMIAIGFGLENMKILTRDEFMQLIFTALLATSLVGIQSFSETFTPGIVQVTGGPDATMQDYALTILSNEITSDLTEDFYDIDSFGQDALFQSSRSEFCSFLSTGLFISSCSSYSMFSPILSIAMQAIAIALVELESLHLLLDFGHQYAFTLFLPFGLFLRTLKITRGAGAFFIALGITLYFILPLSVIFMNDLDEYYSTVSGVNYPPDDKPASLNVDECITTITGNAAGKIRLDNPDKVKTAINNNFFPTGSKPFGGIGAYIYTIFVRVNITLFFCIFTMITALRWLTSVLGAEIDVSALGRLA